MEFPRQEYWTGLSFPSPGDPSNPGIKPRSPALQAESLSSEPPGKHYKCLDETAKKNESDKFYKQGTKREINNTASIILHIHLTWNMPLILSLFSIRSLLFSEKAMAPHSSTLAWKIPWMEEPGGLQSMGSLRVRHD